jgi:hypothetical protein
MRVLTALLLAVLSTSVAAFVPLQTPLRSVGSTPFTTTTTTTPSKPLQAAVPDLDVIALVCGQENYGLAVVALGEGLYSFVQAPSLSGLRVLIPPAIAAVVLVALSGPMITSGDAASVGTGLWIATGVSAFLAVSYILRLVAPFSLVPKEVAFLGLLVAVAGLFSFGQNLLVDGFVTLPSITLPGLPMPPSDIGLDRGVYFS